LNYISAHTTMGTIDAVPTPPAVVQRLLVSGKADALKHVVDPHGGDVAQQLGDALGRAADEGPAERLARRAGFRWPWETR
jgi:hypothetical protein